MIATKITSVSPEDLMGQAQPAAQPEPSSRNAPAIPRDPQTAYTRLGRCLKEYYWLKGGNPRTPDFYYETPAEALADARTVSAVLARELEAI
jgi:hypothetical protein